MRRAAVQIRQHDNTHTFDLRTCAGEFLLWEFYWNEPGFLSFSYKKKGRARSSRSHGFPVCILIVITYLYIVSRDQLGKVANPARGQLNRKNEYPMSPLAPENFISRNGFDRPAPRQPAHCPHSTLRLELVLTHGISPDFRGDVHVFIHYRHMSSGQSRVYRVTQLRTDGVHSRESAGTGPVVLKAVPVMGTVFAVITIWTNLCAPVFSHTTHYEYRVEIVMLKVSEAW